MNGNQIIADEVLGKAEVALQQCNNWMAYNSSLYFIDKDDIYFFDNKNSANQFADNNFSDCDNYAVMYISSVADILRRVSDIEFSNRNTPDGNPLYNKEGNAFTDALIDHIEQQQLLTIKNNNVMNEQNLDFLKGQLKGMGFGEKLYEHLENNLKQGNPEFQLEYKTEFNKKPFEATLNFRKSNDTDMYFFNNYNASVERTNGDKMDQTFYLNKSKGVTAKEAYNLLEGRSVHKELFHKETKEPFKAWIQLDFKNRDKNENHVVNQYHEKYGFDVEKAAGKLPVKELGNAEEKAALLKSIEKGNVQSVTFEKGGVSEKMFLEANPQFKTINVYDGKMGRVKSEQLEEKWGVPQPVKQEASKLNGESVKNDAGKEQGKEKAKEQNQDIGSEVKKNLTKELKPPKTESLLPKKRVSHGKGMKIS